MLNRAAVDELLGAVGLQHLVEDVHFALERKQTHETEDGGFFCQSKLKVSTMNISRKGSIGEELSVTNDSPRL